MSLSKSGELRREEVCAEVPPTPGVSTQRVRMVRCHGRRGNQEWYLTQVRQMDGPLCHAWAWHKLHWCHFFPCDLYFQSLHWKISNAGKLYCVSFCKNIIWWNIASCKTNMNKTFPQTGHVVHKPSNKCLDRAYKQSMDDVFVADCANTITQQWWFDHYNSLWGPRCHPGEERLQCETEDAEGRENHTLVLWGENVGAAVVQWATSQGGRQRCWWCPLYLSVFQVPTVLTEPITRYGHNVCLIYIHILIVITHT